MSKRLAETDVKMTSKMTSNRHIDVMHESRLKPPCKTTFPSPGPVHGNPGRVHGNPGRVHGNPGRECKKNKRFERKQNGSSDTCPGLMKITSDFGNK